VVARPRFREGRKKVCHGRQLAEELLAREGLQHGDGAQLMNTGSAMAHGDWVHLDFNFGVAVSANSEVASGSVRIMDRSLWKLRGRSYSQEVPGDYRGLCS